MVHSSIAASRERQGARALLVAELMIVVTVAALASAAMLPSARVALVKARLTELLGFVLAERVNIHEDLALNGTLDRAARSATGTSDTLEDAMGIGGAPAVDEKPTGHELDAAGQQQLSTGIDAADRQQLASIAYRRERGVLIVHGTAGGEPFRLPMSFAVRADAPTGNLLWLCGHNPPPAGWLFVYGQAETDMPADLLFSICRGETQTQ